MEDKYGKKRDANAKDVEYKFKIKEYRLNTKRKENMKEYNMKGIILAEQKMTNLEVVVLYFLVEKI